MKLSETISQSDPKTARLDCTIRQILFRQAPEDAKEINARSEQPSTTVPKRNK